MNNGWRQKSELPKLTPCSWEPTWSEARVMVWAPEMSGVERDYPPIFFGTVRRYPNGRVGWFIDGANGIPPDYIEYWRPLPRGPKT